MKDNKNSSEVIINKHYNPQDVDSRNELRNLMLQAPIPEDELFNNIGVYFKETNHQQKAFESWEWALQSFAKIDDRFGTSDTYLLMGECYYDQKRFTEALEYAQKAAKLSKDLNVLEGTALAEKLLSSIYEKLNNSTAAFTHFKLYKIAQDSLINHENIRKSVQTEMNYEFEKK